MIQPQTSLQVADNSGARLIQCLKVLGGKKWASVGDMIVVSIKDCLPHRKVKKGDVKKAIVVRTKKEIQRKDGTIISFSENAAVLINDLQNPIGTQIRGPIAKELRATRWTKILSLALSVV